LIQQRNNAPSMYLDFLNDHGEGLQHLAYWTLDYGKDYQRLIAEGAVTDYADLAALGHVTRARITQIMGLLNLAPDIQEALLFLPRTLSGRDPITERKLRPVTAELGWCEQRRMWDEIKDASTSSQGIETSVVPADRSSGTPSRRTA